MMTDAPATPEPHTHGDEEGNAIFLIGMIALGIVIVAYFIWSDVRYKRYLIGETGETMQFIRREFEMSNPDESD